MLSHFRTTRRLLPATLRQIATSSSAINSRFLLSYASISKFTTITTAAQRLSESTPDDEGSSNHNWSNGNSNSDENGNQNSAPPPSDGASSSGGASTPPPSSVPPPAKKKLRAIPMRNWKATDLTDEEKCLPVTTHIFFSSQQPILPFSKVPCQMKTGNLKEINHELGYFILNQDGDVFQIGLELEKQVGKTLSRSFEEAAAASKEQQQQQPPIIPPQIPPIMGGSSINSAPQVNVDLAPKKLSSRLKIIELQVSSNGIFAKTIPFRDEKVSKKAAAKLNFETELQAISKLYIRIKSLIDFEENELNATAELSNLTQESTADNIDRVIFTALGGVIPIYKRYMKGSVNVVIQSLIESRSAPERVRLLKTCLTELHEVLTVVNRGFKMADDNLIRMQAQGRAKLSMEYIRRNYLSNERGEAAAASGQQSGGQGFSSSPQNAQAKAIQNYLSKLHLIEDLPSQERVKQEIDRFSSIDKNSSEYNKINTYLDEVFNVPWKKFTPANWDIQYAKKVLDEEIYGLEKVKERIIQMIAVNQIKNTHAKSKGFVLLLQGPPGTGKTSIAKAIAKSLQKESRFISFAGISDSSFFKGHRRTYVDSQPGVFIKELIKAQTMNPVFVLDEIDKISKSSMGADPYYSLMEILNPEENHNFTDHYLDVKVDFSNSIFILTANNILNMLEPLKNRLEIIEIPAYIEEEKLEISKKYIIPKAIKSNGINEKLVKFDDQTIQTIIKNWCYDEAGVRTLKRCFETISRKYVVELLAGNQDLVKLQQEHQQISNDKEKELQAAKLKSLEDKAAAANAASSNPQNDPNTIYVNVPPSSQTVAAAAAAREKEVEKTQDDIASAAAASKEQQYPTLLSDQTIEELRLPTLDLTEGSSNQMEQLKKYLGVPTFDAEFDSRSSSFFSPGVVNILSVGGFVGHVMKIECVFDNSQAADKKGLFNSTGNLQTVLQESLKIAKINAFNVLSEEAKKNLAARNVHIHFMSGSIPKDGPSAGIAICTAYISLATGVSVPARLAMTGELSPVGEVCKIGGLQAKVIAAKTLSINEVICPYGNIGDADEFPQLLLQGMTLYFVREYKQVHQIVFQRQSGVCSVIPEGVIVLRNGKFEGADDSVQEIAEMLQIQQTNQEVTPTQ